MGKHIELDVLEDKLSQLESANAWSPRVVSRLELHIHSSDDGGLFRINPLSFGRDKGIDEEESIALFLHAARLGLFDMEWHLICPMCSQYVASFSTLRHMMSNFRCATCHVDGTASLDDFIEITFTLSSSVRDLIYHHPETLTAEEFVKRYRWSQGAHYENGMTFLDAMDDVVLVLDYIEPGEKKTYNVELVQGIATGADLIGRSEYFAIIKGEKQDGQRWELAVEDLETSSSTTHLAPGSCTIEITNRGSKRAAVESHAIPQKYLDMDDHQLRFPEFLTGTRLIMNPTFRDLFTTETINPTSGLGVKSVTILFTDLKGSTELYDRIGDLEAFALIQQHFDKLGNVIRERQGVVIKTIGDAVMAAFMRPSDAVLAAVSILREIGSFNDEHHGEQIILKLGIHTGASIAVTLNERLDYFGQTVNIAARVEGMASANEICITDDVYRSPGVAEVLKDLHVRSTHAQLRGVQRGHDIHRITLTKESAEV
jgi:class 3 adenylate cyclase